MSLLIRGEFTFVEFVLYRVQFLSHEYLPNLIGYVPLIYSLFLFIIYCVWYCFNLFRIFCYAV